MGREVQFVSLFGIVAVSLSIQARAAETFYFTGSSSINRSVAGSNTFTQIASNPHPIAVTAHNSKAYWTTYDPGEIWTTPLAGGASTRLLNRGKDTYTRHVQFVGSSMYWNEEGTGAMFRSNEDGTNVQKLFGGYFGYAQGIWDFAIQADRVYWTSWDSGSVRSARLDGSDYRVLDLSRYGRVFSIDADANGLIVGANNQGAGQVLRMGFAGESPLQLASLTNISSGPLDVDLFGGRAYWSYTASSGGLISVIQSCAIDGSDRRTDMSVHGVQIFQFDVIPAPSTLAVFGVWFITKRRRS